MWGCGSQWYSFFPALLKVCEYLCPLRKSPESNDLPLFAVAVCLTLSLLIQMTLVPRLMVMWAGLKRKFWITTVLVCCLRAAATDESARPTPPTSPSIPSLKNSLRVIAMQFPPSFDSIRAWPVRLEAPCSPEKRPENPIIVFGANLRHLLI